ncbi:MAG: S41 family peptidase, partial [Candidatus Omnitrophica bacterium]|nr:S41 family peptidase [Candidatus Omnitrophota bacterium]
MRNKSKRLGFLLTILVIVMLALSLNQILLKTNYAQILFAAAALGGDDFYKEIELYTNTMTIIQREYVDEVNSHDLIYGSLQGMLSSLDPHSQFMPPDDYKDIQVETSGEFGGLGIEITIRDDLLTIISPLEGTPADKAGIQAGDRIVGIEGETTKNINIHDAVKKLRGKPGTEVTITIMREKAKKIFDVTIVRAIIKVESVRKVKMISENIGYIRLATFGEKSANDIEQALDKLAGEGMEALILDLRNNPGGLLNISVKIADKFLDEGKLIVTTRGRKEDQVLEFKAHSDNTFAQYPLVVLVNHGSASASEIVAGAIKDNGRGVLLGTKTFGKGSVQTIIPMPDGSALRLTTAKYFTPSGQCIHDIGIKP